MFSRSSKPPTTSMSGALNREHALACVPVRNPQIEELADENGELCLGYQVRVRPWFQNIIQKITGKTDDLISRKLQLDILGTTVWRMIDGRRTVREIVNDFQAMHHLNRREAEISVTAFLKELGKRGLIVLREGKE